MNWQWKTLGQSTRARGMLIVAVLVGLLLTIAAAPVTLATGSGRFKGKVDYTTGPSPTSQAAGDFNGDGKLDLVTANYSSYTVSVLLGNGDGTFRAKSDYGTGPSSLPNFVAVGDFNRDGKLDIVTANYVYSGNAVIVLPGNGDGTFQAAVGYAAGGTAKSVAVGDFDKDGWPDLVVTNYVTAPSNKISVLLNSGTGTFLAPVTYTAGRYPYMVAVGDLNGDGNLDLAVTSAGGGGVNVLFGTTTGTFLAAVNSSAVVSQTYGVAVADFNRDGKLDLAVTTNGPSNNVHVLLNSGIGTFPAAAHYTATGQGYHESIATGDFNGDGAPDLAVGNSSGNNVSLFLNTGMGTMATAVDSGTGTQPISVGVGRFNQDSAPDLAVVNAASASVSVLLNILVPPTVTAVSPPSGPTSGGTSVTISGTAFEVGATVTIGGAVCAGATVVSGASITCTTGTHAAGAADVTVTNIDGQNGTKAGAYTYVAPPDPAPVAPPPATGPGSSYSGWQSRGGQLVGHAPTLVSFQGQLYAIAVGNGNQVYLTSAPDGMSFGAWQTAGGDASVAWQSAGGIATSAPAAAVHDGALHLFVRGADNALYTTQSVDGVNFLPWRSLGGVLTTAPAATSFNGQLLVYAGGLDRAVYLTSSVDGIGFSDWRSLGGQVVQNSLDPVAVMANQGILQVYARGTDNQLYVMTSGSGVYYSAWWSLGGVLSSGPAAATVGNTTVVYVRGADGRLYETRVSDGVNYSTWRDLGGVLLTAPTATSFNGQVHVATHGADRQVYTQNTQP